MTKATYTTEVNMSFSDCTLTITSEKFKSLSEHRASMWFLSKEIFPCNDLKLAFVIIYKLMLYNRSSKV